MCIYISFFASPSVPLVSRTHTFVLKETSSLPVHAFASLLANKKKLRISDYFLPLNDFFAFFMLAIPITEFAVYRLRAARERVPKHLTIENKRIIIRE